MRYKLHVGALCPYTCKQYVEDIRADPKFIIEDIEYSSVVGPSKFIRNYLKFNSLIPALTQIMSETYNVDLVPTYNFVRMYTGGSVLARHIDHGLCEYSMTLHLGSSDESIPWPIIMGRQGLKLSVGDACSYVGMKVPHERPPCPVDWYMQVFFHWVERNGKCWDHFLQLGSTHPKDY